MDSILTASDSVSYIRCWIKTRHTPFFPCLCRRSGNRCLPASDCPVSDRGQIYEKTFAYTTCCEDNWRRCHTQNPARIFFSCCLSPLFPVCHFCLTFSDIFISFIIRVRFRLYNVFCSAFTENFLWQTSWTVFP